jgi:hypothetical protein
MITRAEIAAENNVLSTQERALWLTLFRSHPSYAAETYPNLVQQLASAAGVTAQQLLAALRKIEAIGDGTVRLSGGSKGLDYDQVRDRNELIGYGLAVLYDSVVISSSVPPFTVVEG